MAELDTGARRVRLERDGADVGYDALLIATGASPRRLRLPARSWTESLTCGRSPTATRSGRGSPAAAICRVVGSGWIGCEIAASARSRGLDVTLASDQELPMQVLGRELGEFYREVHAGQRVELVPGDGLAAFEGDGAVQRLRTESGRVIECDFVVVGAGATPNVELAQQAGLDTGNGILVDERLRSSAPNVYAAGDVAGDVANQWHPFYRIACASSTGQMPSPSGEFIAFWLRDGLVTAGMNVNVWDVNEHVKRPIRSRTQVDFAALTDTGTPLESLAG